MSDFEGGTDTIMVFVTALIQLCPSQTEVLDSRKVHTVMQCVWCW